jgi:O-antigen ligase
MAILIAAVILGTLGGFRSAVLLLAMTFLILFWLEKLWGTRIFVILVMGLTLGGALLVGFADKLPLTIQRSLSFLPLEIDPLTRISAQDSTEWRLEIWKEMLPQVPRYFFKGKGYNLSGDELYMNRESMYRGLAAQWEGAALAGDYHNGPLSVLIPFGIWGLAAFVWLLAAGTRFLYTNFRESAPELRKINAFLLALFLARILFFVFVFGTLHGDLYQFAGILGLSVALNVSGQRLNQPGRLNDGE